MRDPDAEAAHEDLVAAHYAAGRPHVPEVVVRYVVERLAPRVGDNIVDLGCGPGRLIRALSRFHRPLVGIDVSKGMIRQAAEHLLGSSGVFLCTSIDDYYSRWYSPTDAWVLSQSFHLLPKALVRRVVSEQSRAARTAILWIDRQADGGYERRCNSLFGEFRIDRNGFEAFYGNLDGHIRDVGLSLDSSWDTVFEVEFDSEKLASYLFSISYVHRAVESTRLVDFLDRVQAHFPEPTVTLRFTATVALLHKP